MEAVRNILSMSSREFLNYQESVFITWCEIFAQKNKVPNTVFFHSECLKNWFNHNFRLKVVDVFVSKYHNGLAYTTPEIAKDLFEYTVISSQLLDRHPGVLLENEIQKFYSKNNIKALPKPLKTANKFTAKDICFTIAHQN